MNDEKQRLKIAYLTLGDAKDKRTWSCSLYYIAQALQKHCGDVSYIGPILFAEPTLLSKICAKSSLSLWKKRYLHENSISQAKYCGKVATRRLSEQPYDVIVAVASEAAIAYLDTNIPIILVGDATFAQMFDYLPYYSNISQRSVRETIAVENMAIKKSSALVFSSEWAAQSAIEDCHAEKEQVYIVPFGVNFDIIPSVRVAQARKKSEHCKLLFMATDWQRKGGDIAFDTLLRLKERGIPAELIVCGCTPPKIFAHESMCVIPFLDKNDAIQSEKIEQLFATSDFLLLPTRADCAPNVFREANAFGLPVITTDTGGVSGIIREGENGCMLPFAARGNDYAEVIARLYQDDQRYTALVRSSRAAFEDRLNWDAWGSALQGIVLKTMQDAAEGSTKNKDVLAPVEPQFA